MKDCVAAFGGAPAIEVIFAKTDLNIWGKSGFSPNPLPFEPNTMPAKQAELSAQFTLEKHFGKGFWAKTADKPPINFDEITNPEKYIKRISNSE